VEIRDIKITKDRSKDNIVDFITKILLRTTLKHLKEVGMKIRPKRMPNIEE